MPRREKKERGPKKRFGPKRYVLRKRKCRFCADKTLEISYLNHQLLQRLTTERGKITPSRISGTCARHQRKVAKAIKRARHIGILPFLAE